MQIFHWRAGHSALLASDHHMSRGFDHLSHDITSSCTVMVRLWKIILQSRCFSMLSGRAQVTWSPIIIPVSFSICQTSSIQIHLIPADWHQLHILLQWSTFTLSGERHHFCLVCKNAQKAKNSQETDLSLDWGSWTRLFSSLRIYKKQLQCFCYGIK